MAFDMESMFDINFVLKIQDRIISAHGLKELNMLSVGMALQWWNLHYD
jgi:hypothetical protein